MKDEKGHDENLNECTDQYHVWVAVDGKLPLPGDRCKCGKASWTDPEVTEAKAMEESEWILYDRVSTVCDGMTVEELAAVDLALQFGSNLSYARGHEKVQPLLTQANGTMHEDVARVFHKIAVDRLRQ